MKNLLLLPCFFITLTSLAQTQVTIQSGSEITGSVLKEFPTMTSGFGGFSAFAGDQQAGVPRTSRGFLKIDLSAIPAGSKINWARLTLYGTSNMIGFNNTKLMRITSSWKPNTVTWNTQPSTTKRGQVFLAVTTPNEVYKNINVTNLVQQMVDSPATSFGFEIRQDTENTTILRETQFNSPQYSNQSREYPKLVLVYTAPGFRQQETALSIDLNGSSAEMNIYPNPCAGFFNCDIKSTVTENMTLRVIDMLGRTVYSQPVNTAGLQMRVNLPASSAGTYFVIVQDNKNATLVSQQLQVN